MTGVYQIVNKINGQAYIGESVNIERRWAEHKTPRAGGNDRLHSDMKRFGIENFDFSVIEECPADMLLERELHYIRELKPYYNTIGKPIPPDVKKKVSDGMKKWWGLQSKETKDKIVSRNLIGPKKGHPVTAETRKKLREANQGKKQTQETIDKRKATIETKKANGWVHDNSKNRKPVRCVETQEIFPSVKDTGRRFGVKPACISGVLCGRYKTCKGFHFEYLKV